MARKLTTEEFITRAQKIPGNKEHFNYDLTKYKNNRTKIKIFCNIHQVYFWQKPPAHLIGDGGCKLCRAEKLKKLYSYTTEKFIEKANIKHDFKYDYSLVSYIDAYTKVKIICPIHGLFPQKPCDHLQGQGCPECARERRIIKQTSNTEEFNSRADKIHNHKYDYSLVEYINSYTDVEIICPIHGIFPQTPTDHLQGHGCPKCTHLISKPETLWLDSLNIPNDPAHRQVRIKILNRTLRVDGFCPETNTILEFNGDFWHGNPVKFKPEDYNKITHCTYGELYTKTLGKEQILKSAGYNVISIWESDFKRINRLL
jgi:hypothetical protein